MEVFKRETEMVRLVGLEPTTGKTPVDFKPTAYANFATAAPATRRSENSMAANDFGLASDAEFFREFLDDNLLIFSEDRQP